MTVSPYSYEFVQWQQRPVIRSLMIIRWNGEIVTDGQFDLFGNCVR